MRAVYELGDAARLRQPAAGVYGERPQAGVSFLPPDGVLQINARADVVGDYRHPFAHAWPLIAPRYVHLPVLLRELRDQRVGVFDDKTVATVGGGAAHSSSEQKPPWMVFMSLNTYGPELRPYRDYCGRDCE